jgi:hypothetical protein
MKRLGVLSVVAILVMAFFALSAVASNAEVYLSNDKNGQNRVTNIQEGSAVFIVVHDTDENIDCDVRDKIWTDIKIMDPKTGAYIVWISLPEDTVGLGEYWNPEYEPFFGHEPGNRSGSKAFDFLEETGADTGLFVSKRAFTVGARVDWKDDIANTHVVDNSPSGYPTDFQGGNFGYWGGAMRTAIVAEDGGDGVEPFTFFAGPLSHTDPVNYSVEVADIIRGGRGIPSVLPPVWYDLRRPGAEGTGGYLRGLFENMDTLMLMYVDQNDPTDVAVGLAKIIDTEATITWDQEIYKDANTSATITIVDADENLNCNVVEYVPVFILVNPGSWNPVDAQSDSELTERSATNFCMLKTWGGVDPETAAPIAEALAEYPFDGETIRWYNIYDSGLPLITTLQNKQETEIGSYYVQYPTLGDEGSDPEGWNVTHFDTADPLGLCRVMFLAQETGVNTGVFEFRINSILNDLGFNALDVRDVLVAYYVDPNDEDDFKLDTAYIEEKMHSITSFTDATRQEKKLFWLGRDPVYVQVIDANANVDPCCPEQVVIQICDVHNEDDVEWIILDETSSNSPVFFSNTGYELRPVWDAMGNGEVAAELVGAGGFQLWFDNWKVEAYNEDDIYARYNDVYYASGVTGVDGIGDANPLTAMPPRIDRVRVDNDVSFDLMSIGDTQVYNGSAINMYFLDRQGNRVQGYVNSDCVFIEVVDPDQDEDQMRRERIDGFWDGGYNLPFGPLALREFLCEPLMGPRGFHPVNDLLGDTNIFNNGAAPKVYVLNPRSGFWAPIDLLENGVATGDFVSVICVDLVSVYTCVPTLFALPGDTIVAFYQDPSNHSDSAMISVKVGIGGGGTPPSQQSTTTFTNATGAAVVNYTDADLVYVKVVDPSHAGATTLANAVTIGTQTYGLTPLAGGATNDTFITAGLDLNLTAGTTITATYKDPTDPTDTSSKTITVVASKLVVTSFYAGPNPSAGDVTFGYKGSGIATLMTVKVYDLAGHLVWANELANVTKIVWNGKDDGGAYVANGAYIYMLTAKDGTDTFSSTTPGGKGTVFINR